MDVHITKKEIKQIYNQLKSSAAKRNIRFDLKLTDLHELSFPLTCPILGVPLVYHKGSPQDNSFSVDRIDSSKGYTIDNLIVVSNRVNKIKSNATLEELIKIVEFYVELTKKEYPQT